MVEVIPIPPDEPGGGGSGTGHPVGAEGGGWFGVAVWKWLIAVAIGFILGQLVHIF